MNLYQTKTSIKKLQDHILLFYVPAFGLLMPYSTKLLDNLDVEVIPVISGYAFCVLLSFMIWKGNLFLMNKMRVGQNFFTGILVRMFASVAFTILYTLVISYLMLLFLDHYLFNDSISSARLKGSILVAVIASIIGNNLYEIILLRNEKAVVEYRARENEIAKMHERYASLNLQFDVHFIFNTLNTIYYLTESDPVRSREFIKGFAHLYRYMLDKRNDKDVSLKEELDFIIHYFQLLKVRSGNAIQLTVESDRQDIHCKRIIPFSLQPLVENAVKHNAFTSDHPLLIHICINDHCIEVFNNRLPLIRPAVSTGIGLNNLKERYRLLKKRDIFISATDNEFRVRLPL